MKHVARRMWTLFEPLHAVTYFTPEARERFEAAGLRGFWRSYFAARAAPLGPVDAPAVTAAFFNFAPTMVARAIPGVWSLATPEQALQARQAGAVAGLARLRSNLDSSGADTAGPGWADASGTGASGAEASMTEASGETTDAATTETAEQLAEAAELLTAAAGHADTSGRVLAAANQALPIPDGVLGRLWRAATVLREHRGDGHIAALVAWELDGCDALAWRTSLDLSREVLQPARGWTDDEWNDSLHRLKARGWLDIDGLATAEAAQALREVEAVTDRVAQRPWDELGQEATERLITLLTPLAQTAYSDIPHYNPIGLPSPILE